MARNFALNQDAAREANSGGKQIRATGKYKGTITAFYDKSDKGAESVNLMFESDQGQTCGPLSIYTHNKDGKELPGFKLVNAIMVCVRTRSLTTAPGNVELYDFDTNSVQTKQKDVYQELSGKKIGLVLQQEEMTDKDGHLKLDNQGNPKYRMTVSAPFDYQSELMAVEILDKKATPEQLGKVLEYIMANPVRFAKKKAGNNNQPPPNFEGLNNDDIPGWD